MRTREQYILEYAASHRNRVNQRIHMVCVPAIFFSSIAFGFLMPVGTWVVGQPGQYAPWINVATIAAIPLLLFYARLGWWSLLTGAAWIAAALVACAAIQLAGGRLLPIAVISFVTAWIVQFVGHHLERARPSFFKDLYFLLIGPLFVQDKLNRLLPSGSPRGS